MISEDLLYSIVELAKHSYRKKIHPSAFAVQAATLVALDAAKQHSPEAADFAAFTNATSLIELAKFASYRTANNTVVLDEMQQFGKKASKKKDHSELNKLVDELYGIDIHARSKKTFNKEFPLKNKAHQEALEATQLIFVHAFAVSLAAYNHAVALAGKIKLDEETDSEQANKAENHPKVAKKEEVFRKALLHRLSTDLNHTPVEPNFMLRLLGDPAFKAVAITLLVASLAVLATGIVALCVPAVAAAITTAVGITAVGLAVGGGVATTLSATSLGLGIFATHKIKERDALSVNAANDLNRTETTTFSLK